MLNNLQKKYLELTKFGPFPTPYFFHIRKGGQILYYLGFEHTYDPKDASWGVLENYLQDFINQTDGKKRLVLVEGGEKTLPYSRKEQIKTMGESYYTWFLAQASAIQVSSPEPDTTEQLKHLAKNFSKDLIITALYAEQISIRSNYIKPENMENSLETYIDYLKRISGWESEFFTMQSVQRCYKEVSGIDLDYNNLEYIKKETDPYLEENQINEVINSKSQFKDKIILENIENLWGRGYNLFIVFGKNHSIIHEITMRQWS
ncbi:MAG TPA: hypothetical protein PLX95_03560 [bacterium]|nr:hypothetical protein [bacterium]